MRQSVLVVLSHAGIPLESHSGIGFTVDEIQPAMSEWRIDFLPGQYLNDRDVEIKSAQQIESLLDRRRRHQKVGDQDRLSRPAQSSQVVHQRLGQLQRT